MRRFTQCDVFSPTPLQGNGLAVVVDADGLTDDQMQRFAAWTHLAETTFLLPPSDSRADYRVRIFTPRREMPFAGHPTLGSCFAWLRSGGQPRTAGRVRQECAIGLVEVDVSLADTIAFEAPPTRVEPMPAKQHAAIVEALSIPPEAILRTATLTNGPTWQVFELDSAKRVLAIDSSRVSWPAFLGIGLIGPHPAGSECDDEVRMLAPSSGMSEDPITGSLNAAIARWRHAEGRLLRAVTVAQGTAIGRHGRVFIRPDATGSVWVGGHVQAVIEGQVDL